MTDYETLKNKNFKYNAKYGLYSEDFEHDACGVGMVANIKSNSSHKIVEQSLEVLEHLGHRGAAGSDPLTGDGAGITVQMPHEFFVAESKKLNFILPDKGLYAVAMCFLPNDNDINSKIKKIIEKTASENGLKIITWRNVPINPSEIGKSAKSLMPRIEQLIVQSTKNSSGDDFERSLYLTRKTCENQVKRINSNEDLKDIINREFYICSWSSRTIIYKGMLLVDQLRKFYPDLSNKNFNSAFGLVHSRFSTNTLGSWKLAHPYRMLAHNGEINTVRGNRNWMQAREKTLNSNFFGDKINNLTPVCESDSPSDTASLDNVFELLRMSGRSIEHTAAMMIPAAWYDNDSISKETQDFYEYHGNLMEPWDGPAMVIFTDGTAVGAVLDRNGLRPFRYFVTKNDLLVMGSETGVLNVDEEDILYKSRLEPGKMFLLDFNEKRIIEPEELMKNLSSANPYGEWLDSNRVTISQLEDVEEKKYTDMDNLINRQVAFGYTKEELDLIIKPMAITAHQPQGSMGNDAPLAVLSDKPQNLFAYFKQAFAQVSNPPLDAIREKLFTQRAVPVGRRPNIFDTTPDHCKTIRIDHPILLDNELKKIQSNTKFAAVKTKTISTLFEINNSTNLEKRIEQICHEADKAISDGYTILVLSDRGVDKNHSYIPSLLAVGSVHHYLIRKRIRSQADIIVESGEPREVHHFATLFGYGASAINPYLAFESIEGIRLSPLNEESIPEKNIAENNFREAVEEGVVKTMAKMGISTLQGYMGAQIFEALGLSQSFVDKYFTWTTSRISGIGLAEINEDLILNHSRAFAPDNIPSNLKMDLGGLYLWRSTGERHMWNPNTIALLQDAVKRNDKNIFTMFEESSDNELEDHVTLRNMIEPVYGNEIPIADVESAEKIVERFATGAISLGSISREAHETMAIATNRINARSNTGEGGEDPERFELDSNGDSRSSAVKQVASGRFGVTTNYLVNAKDLQIKMAQGAKPGEGGELPGKKISEYIGYIRKTTPGVELISPPPHHDIYSIEDLAQLIHDLKNVNTNSRVHVKLVSVAGVGVIAAGVAKGKGDVVLISGDSGGTGASPLSSIRHAGVPWELGLAETQQVLVANGLRDRIIVQTDGQMKTSKDVLIGALLGAEEWGIATGALISMGCIMLRKCHLNTCSVGVATQDPELRKKFTGTPDAVINYFMFLAEGLRVHMAKMGFKTVNEMVGRVDKLRIKENITHWKAKKLDLSPILHKPETLPNDHAYCCISQDHGLKDSLDNKIIEISLPKIKNKATVRENMTITNLNRTVGATLSGEITKLLGSKTLEENTININFKGSAGQSFGAFLVKGINFNLEGDANDYVGKGLSGGRIIIKPSDKSTLISDKNIIIGNVALYGATGGEAYISGLAGERFAVRNSSAVAVVEGIGDHGCEYMTGGCVVVLGKTGRNFGAGMSGGVAFVLDHDGSFENNFDKSFSDILKVENNQKDIDTLKKLISNHKNYTGSKIAEKILNNWNSYQSKFLKVLPREFGKIIKENNREEFSFSE
ncbi:MAG: glutamate synthase large subunit [Dehalococcoidia bacterium]